MAQRLLYRHIQPALAVRAGKAQCHSHGIENEDLPWGGERGGGGAGGGGGGGKGRGVAVRKARPSFPAAVHTSM